MLAQGLPPQFFYLALQESNFDIYTVGPKTYKGYAKGMWQFIPETAIKYGLRVGPLVDLSRPDPGDERHNFEKATSAAARYLKFIYSTDAQASGLLVMSSYNWGEEKVVKLLRSMPANPKDRNFWRLLDELSGQDSPGNLRLCILHRIRSRNRRESPSLWFQIRQSFDRRRAKIGLIRNRSSLF